jgi:hypothetical protein
LCHGEVGRLANLSNGSIPEHYFSSTSTQPVQ